MKSFWARLRSLLPSPTDYAQVPKTWRSDLLAGLTVGIVALPLALAFGVSSGAGAASGLITAVIAGIVAAVFGGSHVQVSGPTGAMVVVLGPVIASHGLGALALVGVLAGIIVLLAGMLRLGRVVAFLPWPVIEGFTFGIAVIIFLQQVPSGLGVKAGESSNAVVATFQSLSNFSWNEALWPLVIVALVAVIMTLTPRIHPKIPASIIAIIAATALSHVLSWPVARIGALPSSLPAPALPVSDWSTIMGLAVPAATIAALAAIESLLSARVAVSLSDTGAYQPDRELVGQGLASIASGMFGGMPATGAIARTAVNIRSGGRTRLAAITHAFVLLGVVYLATGPVATIPLAALSGVLMVTAVQMISPTTLKAIVGSTRTDTIIFFTTAIITVTFDLIEAVAIGVGLAAIFALRALIKTSKVHREELPGPVHAGDERIALFRIDGALFFGAAEKVLEQVTSIHHVEVVIIRLSNIRLLDATGARIITDLTTNLERRGITVLIKGIQDQHLPLLTKVGAVDSLRHHKHLFTNLEPAIEHARNHIHRNHTSNALAETRTDTAAEGKNLRDHTQ